MNICQNSKNHTSLIFLRPEGGKHPFFSFNVCYSAPKGEQEEKAVCKSDLPFPRYRPSKFEVYINYIAK